VTFFFFVQTMGAPLNATTAREISWRRGQNQETGEVSWTFFEKKKLICVHVPTFVQSGNTKGGVSLYC
jgi:hypothetical protein